MRRFTARTLILLMVSILLAASCGSTEGGDTTANADIIPDVEVETFDGDVTSTHAFLGEPMVVNFWASWCAPCVEEMPAFQAVSEELEGQVRFLGIDTQDGIVPAQRLIEETGVTYDLVRDPDARAFAAFGIRGMPTTFLVAADGTILLRRTGALTADDLRDAIREHLLDEAPA